MYFTLFIILCKKYVWVTITGHIIVFSRDEKFVQVLDMLVLNHLHRRNTVTVMLITTPFEISTITLLEIRKEGIRFPSQNKCFRIFGQTLLQHVLRVHVQT